MSVFNISHMDTDAVEEFFDNLQAVCSDYFQELHPEVFTKKVWYNEQMMFGFWVYSEVAYDIVARIYRHVMIVVTVECDSLLGTGEISIKVSHPLGQEKALQMAEFLGTMVAKQIQTE
jgi:hypothetical protein